ncbi:hypothetical protein ACHAWO_000165 [Cyclotella atomus]|uniref:J domain-containing protein n=1 Tax=Cyclotella atomus TaxID=382360 RepID=A0ABD3NU60_9STRA
MEKRNQKAPKRIPNCRFGSKCRNIDKGCKFIHPPVIVKAPPPVDLPPKTTKAAPKRPKAEIPCRYGMHCSDAKCPYFHHPSSTASAPSSPKKEPSSPVRKPKKNCRYGPACKNKKCGFVHPSVPAAAAPAGGCEESVASLQNSESYSTPTPLTGFTASKFPIPSSEIKNTSPPVHSPLFAKGSTNSTPLSKVMSQHHSPLQEVLSSLSPEDDWLKEVLGSESNKKMQYDKSSQPPLGDFTAMKGMTPRGKTVSETSPTASMETEASPPEDIIDPYDKVVLLSQRELEHYTKAALDLQTESSKVKSNFLSLLEMCHVYQKNVQSTLEEATHNEDSEDIDEENLMLVLELNELLCGAIKMAEEVNRVRVEKALEEARGKNIVQTRVEAPKANGRARMAPSNDGKKAQGAPTRSERPTPAADVAFTKAKNDAKKAQPKANNEPKKAEKAQQSNGTAADGTKASVAQPKQSADNPKAKKEKAQPNKIDSSNSKVSFQEPAKEPDPIDTTPKVDPIAAAKEEKDRIARLVQEAREQAAAAKAKKKSKKSHKFDKWLHEQEAAKENREKFWGEKIAKEIDYIDLTQKILVAEFVRQSKEKVMGLTSDRVLSDPHASAKIDTESREAYDTIFRDVKVRVVVAGSETKDLNGRTGTIRYWDRDKEKFCVGLNTKKSTGSTEIFLTPDVLDAVASAPSRSNKAEKQLVTSYDVGISELMVYGGVALGLNFTLTKGHINTLGAAESIKTGLKAFCRLREEEERRKKLEEERRKLEREQEKAREEEDRKRRAAKKAAEEAAWNRRREEMRREKERFERAKRKFRGSGGFRGFNNFDFDAEDDEGCDCPKCQFQRMFMGGSSGFSGFRRSSSGGFVFTIGGIPIFGMGGDSDDEDYFDDFDERMEEELLQEKMEENRKQAEILGVDPETDERTIKVAYRKLALTYHPDKWKSDSEHGMSKSDAENKFKMIQSAYDHLMSNFDEEDDEDSGW